MPVIGRGESGQLCCTSPLSIYNATVAGECIQSEALNVDTPKCMVSLVEQIQPDLPVCTVIFHRKHNACGQCKVNTLVLQVFCPIFVPFSALYEYCKQQKGREKWIGVCCNHLLLFDVSLHFFVLPAPPRILIHASGPAYITAHQ